MPEGIPPPGSWPIRSFAGMKSGLARGFDCYRDFPVDASGGSPRLEPGLAAFAGCRPHWRRAALVLHGDPAGTVNLDFTRKDAQRDQSRVPGLALEPMAKGRSSLS